MNFEQIMIRLGVDGTAVKAGLGKVSATVKAWGASLASGMKDYMGSIAKGFLGAEAISKGFQYLGQIKDKILEIARVSNETGANTNFVQGLMGAASKAGVPFEGLTGGIARFNKMLGAAKEGNVDALTSLKDMGVITGSTTAKTLTFTGAMHNLAVNFDKLNDKQKQAYLLSQAFGKSGAAMQPVFEKGVGGVDAMSQGSFFTKISSGTIGDFQTVWNSIKTGSGALMATVANIVDLPFRSYRKQAQYLGELSTGVLPFTKKWKQDMESINATQEGINAQKAIEAMADKEGISVAEKKMQIQKEYNDALDQQTTLQAEIGDRDKESISTMATKARHILGLKSPEEMQHTVTPAARLALKVDTLEERARIRAQYHDEAGRVRLQGEADQIRNAPQNTWAFKLGDREPMREANRHLAEVNQHLQIIAPVMDLIKPTS